MIRPVRLLAAGALVWAATPLAFDNSFGEVIENLDAAFFANALIHRDRFIVAAVGITHRF